MEIVQLPFGQPARRVERTALRRGLGRSAARPFLRVIDLTASPGTFCAACALPLESGVVWRGQDAFCSVACSLGTNHPA